MPYREGHSLDLRAELSTYSTTSISATQTIAVGPVYSDGSQALAIRGSSSLDFATRSRSVPADEGRGEES